MARVTTAGVGPSLQPRDKLLVRRVHDSLVKCGLNRIEYSGASGATLHVPLVVAADARPPAWVQIDLLPGQSAEDFAIHAAAIARNLGVSHVWVVPLGRSRIRLELPAQRETI